MDDALQHLRELFPTSSSRDVGAEEWAAIETELGTTIPDDYKALLATYSTTAPPLVGGFWYDFLTPKGRQDAAEGNSYLRNLRDGILETEREYARHTGRDIASVPSPIPFPVFPEENGLFEWGWMQDWITFHWLRVGPPNRWDVIVASNSVDELYRFPGWNATRFLSAILEDGGFGGIEAVEKLGSRISRDT